MLGGVSSQQVQWVRKPLQWSFLKSLNVTAYLEVESLLCFPSRYYSPLLLSHTECNVVLYFKSENIHSNLQNWPRHAFHALVLLHTSILRTRMHRPVLIVITDRSFENNTFPKKRPISFKGNLY